MQRDRLAHVGLKALQLREEQARALLGGISHGRYLTLRKAVEENQPTKRLSQDEMTRLSLFTGIAKALRILHSPALADNWVCMANSNQIFRGAAPVDVMITGGIPAMLQVRRLLDARRGC